MAHEKILNEIALNRREVTHPVWGSFIIRRPTNRILSQLDTLRTRSLNKDLQQKEVVADPLTGENKLVPAFLTRKKKAELLAEMGEWTLEDQKAVEDANKKFVQACLLLDDAGYESTFDTVSGYQELREQMLAELGDLAEELSEELAIVFPMGNADPNDVETFPPVLEGYDRAKAKIESTAKSFAVRELLEAADAYHKQYGLLIEGIEAQSTAYILRFREVTLFSDTIEARADYKVRIGKLFHCVYNTDNEPYWATQEECEDMEFEIIQWLSSQVEAFERLDPNDTDEDKNNMEKFNFLSSVLAKREGLEESPEATKPKEDGQPVEKTPSSSTEVLEPQTKS